MTPFLQKFFNYYTQLYWRNVYLCKLDQLKNNFISEEYNYQIRASSPLIGAKSNSGRSTPHHHMLCQEHNCVPKLNIVSYERSRPILGPSSGTIKTHSHPGLLSQSESPNDYFLRSRGSGGMTSSVTRKQKSRRGICDIIQDGRLVNNAARFLFPIGFLVFNLIYWITLFVFVHTNNQQNEFNDSIKNHAVNWIIYHLISLISRIHLSHKINKQNTYL